METKEAEKELKLSEKVGLVKQQLNKSIALLCELPTMYEFFDLKQIYQSRLIQAVEKLNEIRNDL